MARIGKIIRSVSVWLADLGGILRNPGVWWRTRREARLTALVSSVQRAIERHALTWDDMPPLLRAHALRTGLVRTETEPRRLRELGRRPQEDPVSSRRTRLERAAEEVIKHGVAPARDDFRGLVNELRDLLGVEFHGVEVLDTGWTHLRRRFANVVAVVIFLFVGYVVIGGLATGESALLGHANPIATLLVLGLLLLLLAAVEALHISVTILRLGDLGALRDQFPRTWRLHEIFRYEQGTRRFLAGRQLLVIMTVFFTAQLTSFPGMKEFPYTDIAIPGWFHKVALELGIAGAFFVLWFGQLTPQFLANRRPLWFMNLQPISWLFHAALFLESLGITRPGEWLSARVEEERAERPLSPQERYRQAVEEIEGWGTVGTKKLWRIEPDQASLSCETSTIFTQPGFQGFVDDAVIVHGGLSDKWHDTTLISEKGTEGEVSSQLSEERLPKRWKKFVLYSEPRYGGQFDPGDVLIHRQHFVFKEAWGVDPVSVVRPTKLILFSIEFGDAKKVGRGRVELYKPNLPAEEEDRRPIETHELKLERRADGVRFFEFVVFYPDVNSHYLFLWDVEY